MHQANLHCCFPAGAVMRILISDSDSLLVKPNIEEAWSFLHAKYPGCALYSEDGHKMTKRRLNDAIEQGALGNIQVWAMDDRITGRVVHSNIVAHLEVIDS